MILGTTRGPWGQTHFESVGAGLLSDTIADIDHGESGFVNELDDSDSRVTAAVVFERIVRAATPVPYQLTLDGHNGGVVTVPPPQPDGPDVRPRLGVDAAPAGRAHHRKRASGHNLCSGGLQFAD